MQIYYVDYSTLEAYKESSSSKTLSFAGYVRKKQSLSTDVGICLCKKDSKGNIGSFVLESRDFSNLDLGGLLIKGMFIGCDLSDVKFINSNLDKAEFKDCSLKNSNFLGIDIYSLKITFTRLEEKGWSLAEQIMGIKLSIDDLSYLGNIIDENIRDRKSTEINIIEISQQIQEMQIEINKTITSHKNIGKRIFNYLYQSLLETNSKKIQRIHKEKNNSEIKQYEIDKINHKIHEKEIERLQKSNIRLLDHGTELMLSTVINKHINIITQSIKVSGGYTKYIECTITKADLEEFINDKKEHNLSDFIRQKKVISYDIFIIPRYKDANLSDMKFINKDMSNCIMSRVNIANCAFISTKLNGSSFEFSKLDNVGIRNVSAINTNFAFSSISNTKIFDSNFLLSNFIKSDINKVSLNGCNFFGTILRKAYLNMASIKQSNLSNSDMRLSSISNSEFIRTKMSYIQLQASIINTAMMEGIDISKSLLDDVNLYNTVICNGSDLSSIHAKNIKIKKTTLEKGVTLENANLNNAFVEKLVANDVEFTNANLQSIVIRDCIITNSNMDNINAKFSRFENVISKNNSKFNINFFSAYIQSCDFSCSRLKEAIFTNANLHESIFLEAILDKSDMTNATIYKVDFSRAKLRGCKFHTTIVKYANFSEANISGLIVNVSTELQKIKSIASIGKICLGIKENNIHIAMEDICDILARAQIQNKSYLNRLSYKLKKLILKNLNLLSRSKIIKTLLKREYIMGGICGMSTFLAFGLPLVLPLANGENAFPSFLIAVIGVSSSFAFYVVGSSLAKYIYRYIEYKQNSTIKRTVNVVTSRSTEIANNVIDLISYNSIKKDLGITRLELIEDCAQAYSKWVSENNAYVEVKENYLNNNNNESTKAEDMIISSRIIHKSYIENSFSFN